MYDRDRTDRSGARPRGLYCERGFIWSLQYTINIPAWDSYGTVAAIAFADAITSVMHAAAAMSFRLSLDLAP